MNHNLLTCNTKCVFFQFSITDESILPTRAREFGKIKHSPAENNIKDTGTDLETDNKESPTDAIPQPNGHLDKSEISESEQSGHENKSSLTNVRTQDTNTKCEDEYSSFSEEELVTMLIDMVGKTLLTMLIDMVGTTI